MADQVGSGTVAGVPQESGALSQATGEGVHTYGEPFHGRPVSWVAVSIIMAAFVLGGLALVFGTIWWLFWVAVGIAAVGGLTAVSTGIFNDWY